MGDDMSVQRFDKIDAPDWMIKPFTKTPEGFLSGRACVTNIGIFPYRLDDGSIQYELRHPDDVFAQESMDSLKLKPMTNDHPPEMLNPENVKKYQVGNLGDNPINGDNIHLTIDAIIQDGVAIDAVNAGKRELSCGYMADVVDESGTWMGVPYTKRQKNICYNHVALVDVTRAGEAACVKLDAGGGEMVNIVDLKNAAGAVNSKEDIMPDMKMVKLDGVDYQAEAQVIAALTTVKASLDSADKMLTDEKKKVSALEAERDSLKESNEQLKKDQMDAKKLDEAVKAKIRILSFAKEAEVEVKNDMSDEDIKKAVILKKFPNAKLDGRDAVYINGRFDCACEEIEAHRVDAAAVSLNTAGAGNAGGALSKEDVAKKAYHDRIYGKKE
jgi:uncharacterized protein